jgi:hypothetical protein
LLLLQEQSLMRRCIHPLRVIRASLQQRYRTSFACVLALHQEWIQVRPVS